MTIGIGAAGPNAGLAVYRALASAEKVGEGSIGGFVVLAVLTEEGEVRYATTQRGGTSTLFVAEEKGVLGPPGEIASARRVALISSGPDRPEPLERIVPAAADAGLITGHRIPVAVGVSGERVNDEALDRLRKGDSATEAVEGVLRSNPEADVGLIAVDVNGDVAGFNTDRVKRRPDTGEAYMRDESTGAAVHVLLNSIRPVSAVATLAAEIAMSVMTSVEESVRHFILHPGTPVEGGDADRVELDAESRVVKIVTADPTLLKEGAIGAIPYIESPVFLEGRVIGRVSEEALVEVSKGAICRIRAREASAELRFLPAKD